MKLYSSKIPIVARDIINQLVTDGDIEVSNRDEAEMDIQSVLKEYLRSERAVNERTKDLLEARGLDHGQFGKVKRAVAEDLGFALADEGVNWMCGQILEAFMHSSFVDEIYASDADMRKKLKTIIGRHMMVDDELDREVRQRIQNLQEGSAAWDVEYSKVMEQIKAKHGLKK